MLKLKKILLQIIYIYIYNRLCRRHIEEVKGIDLSSITEEVHKVVTPRYNFQFDL